MDFARTLERELLTAQRQLAEREHQWKFGCDVIDFCIQNVAYIQPGELPLDAIRRWMKEGNKLP